MAVLKPGSSPLRRLVREAREDHMLLDATMGKKTRSILIMNSGHVILSPSLPETILDRADRVEESREERPGSNDQGEREKNEKS